uniref:Uncharacterized protein n=1 Tax=Leersia perrieri TaxID=77586 RepID=A0A0D9XE97_9ORYZ
MSAGSERAHAFASPSPASAAFFSTSGSAPSSSTTATSSVGRTPSSGPGLPINKKKKRPFRPVADDTKPVLRDPISRSDPVETAQAILLPGLKNQVPTRLAPTFFFCPSLPIVTAIIFYDCVTPMDSLTNAQAMISTPTSRNISNVAFLNNAAAPPDLESSAPANHRCLSAADAVILLAGLNVRSPFKTSNPSCDSIVSGKSSRSRSLDLDSKALRVFFPGTPTTSKILSSCSLIPSPRNNALPERSFAMTQPSDHMSTSSS